jgi:hypothetical protein
MLVSPCEYISTSIDRRVVGKVAGGAAVVGSVGAVVVEAAAVVVVEVVAGAVVAVVVAADPEV